MPESTDLFGLWGGVVEDDQDPERLGRVRVRVFDMHDEDTPVDELPWALPCFPSAFCKHPGSGAPSEEHKNGGFFHIPPVDALVHVMFRNGNPDKPVWIGGWFPADEPIHGRETYRGHTRRKVLYNGSTIPSCPTWGSLRGFRFELDDEAAEYRITTPKGHKITLSDSASNEHYDCIKLEDHKGNYIWMDDTNDILHIYWNGDCEERITGNYHRLVEGNEVRHVLGNVSEDYGGKLDSKQGDLRNVDAPTINHNCGLAAPEAVIKAEPGVKSSGDHVKQVLVRLGNNIKKILTGG